MALGDLTPQDDDDNNASGGKSTHIKFENPRVVGVEEEPSSDSDAIAEKEAHRHQQEFYDAAKELRNMMGPDINVPVGRFLHAAVQAEKHDNNEPLEELFEDITS